MKRIFTSLFFLIANFVCHAQCSTVGVQITSSDTTYIQLYQAGFFNIPSGFANVCEWEVTSFSGDLIHQATTSGGANEQSTTIFDHSVSLTDSMKATIVITNEMEGIICTISDTLYWKETEVIPGAFIGNWDILHGNGGEEEEITSSTELVQTMQNIKLFPSPTDTYFEIKSELDIHSFVILDLNGQVLETYKNIQIQKKVDVSHYTTGMYFIQFLDKNNKNLGVEKMIKM